MKPKSTFNSTINYFIGHIESLRVTYPVHIQQITNNISNLSKKLDKLIEEKAIQLEEPKKAAYEIKVEDYDEFIKIIKSLQLKQIAYKTFTQGSIISLISQFDSFIGNLVRLLYLNKPEIINTSDKNIPFVKLLEFENIDEARSYFIEKEVESVLRLNHKDQFKWFESRLNISLRKELDIWQDFIEITERRNLFVHCDGRISDSYIINCKNNHIDLSDEIIEGNILKVTPKYFKNSCDVLYELGVKLGQVLWRKLCPESIDEADTHLINNVTYELLRSEQFDLAIKLSDFGHTNLKKHFNEETKRIILINSGIAYKAKGNQDKVEDILSSVDWNGWSGEFQIAVLVLNDNFLEASYLMKKIGLSNARLTEKAYLEWPLFKDFRETESFKEVFAELFKRPSLDLSETVE